ncbi:hypothetical protein ACLOJK_021712 [Asimina triloba]
MQPDASCTPSLTKGRIKCELELTSSPRWYQYTDKPKYALSLDSGPEFATGVTGKEFVLFAVVAEKTLVRENDLEVEGFSSGSSDVGVPGMMRTVFSHSGTEFLVLKLLCGSKFLIDGFPFAELGRGGKPDLAETGLVKEVMFILVEGGHELSKDLAGIFNDKRFGRLLL